MRLCVCSEGVTVRTLQNMHSRLVNELSLSLYMLEAALFAVT